MKSEISFINKRVRLSKYSKDTINRNKIFYVKDINELKDFNETIKQMHEVHLLKQKEMILDFKNRFNQNEIERNQILLNEINNKLSALNNVLDDYYNEIEIHIDRLLNIVLEKLCIDLNDEIKIKSVISMVIRDYREEINVILKCSSCVDLSCLDIPVTWEIIKDDALEKFQCKLELKFGEVLADFDFALNEIMK